MGWKKKLKHDDFDEQWNADVLNILKTIFSSLKNNAKKEPIGKNG